MCVGSLWSFLSAFAQGSCFHASIIKWNNFNNRHHTFQMNDFYMKFLCYLYTTINLFPSFSKKVSAYSNNNLSFSKERCLENIKMVRSIIQYSYTCIKAIVLSCLMLRRLLANKNFIFYNINELHRGQGLSTLPQIHAPRLRCQIQLNR